MLPMVSPPTAITQTLRRILGILCFLTLIQGIFLMFTSGYKTTLYMISFVIYLGSICRLSYFGCILNQFLNVSLIWFLLVEMAIKLKVGLYEVYLSSEGLYKMSSLIFAIICLYFNFVAYKEFKQVAYEIFKEENPKEEDEKKGKKDYSERNQSI